MYGSKRVSKRKRKKSEESDAEPFDESPSGDERTSVNIEMLLKSFRISFVLLFNYV